MWTTLGVCLGAAYGLTLGYGFIFALTLATQILGADVWLVRHTWAMALTLSIPLVLGGLCGLGMFERQKRRSAGEADIPAPQQSSAGH